MTDLEFLVLRLKFIGFKMYDNYADGFDGVTDIRTGRNNTLVLKTASGCRTLYVHEDGDDYVFRFMDDRDSFLVVPKVDILGEPN